MQYAHQCYKDNGEWLRPADCRFQLWMLIQLSYCLPCCYLANMVWRYKHTIASFCCDFLLLLMVFLFGGTLNGILIVALPGWCLCWWTNWMVSRLYCWVSAKFDDDSIRWRKIHKKLLHLNFLSINVTHTFWRYSWTTKLCLFALNRIVLEIIEILTTMKSGERKWCMMKFLCNNFDIHFSLHVRNTTKDVERSHVR